MISIFPTTRVRRSPYYDATVADGVTAMVPYNRMLMPASYGDPEAEYHRLVNGVSMWDVACERQIQLAGPDAEHLTQILTTRDVNNVTHGQGRYAALCNHRGVIMNDPVLMRIDDDTFWFSIADSDVREWAQTIAAERGLDVEVTEPDVSPLAVQGPKAVDVVASMFGDTIRELKYFGFMDASIGDIPLKIARSGWSKQGGYELYLMDGSRGTELWNLVKEAGQPWDIGPGTPNPSERMESGLLSFGSDTDSNTNPFEVRLDKFVNLDVPNDVIGIKALRRIAKEGPKRHQLGVMLDTDQELGTLEYWRPVSVDGEAVGHMTCGTWSYKFERNIGFVLVSVDTPVGARVEVNRAEGQFQGTLVELPFTEIPAA